MRRHIQHIIIVLTTCLLSSCIDKYDAELPLSDTKLVYVEGDIKSEQTCTFKFTFTASFDSKDLEYMTVIDANVVGDDGTIFTSTTSPMGTGIATIEVGTLNPKTKYHLEATVLNEDMELVTIKSKEGYPTDKNEIVDIKFHQNEDDKKVNILVSTSEKDEDQYFKWEYSEDWELHTVYACYYEYNPKSDAIELLKKPKHIGWASDHQKTILTGMTSYKSGKCLTDYKVYGIESNDNRISVRYRTKVRQYTISKEHYEYEQARLQLSEEMGGLFTPQPSEFPTNITLSDGRRALGFVDIMGGYDEKELYINKSDVEYTPEQKIIGYPSDAVLAKSTNMQLYKMGYQVIMHTYVETKWGSAWSVDVTKLGASLTKPEGWTAE